MRCSLRFRISYIALLKIFSLTHVLNGMSVLIYVSVDVLSLGFFRTWSVTKSPGSTVEGRCRKSRVKSREQKVKGRKENIKGIK